MKFMKRVKSAAAGFAAIVTAVAVTLTGLPMGITKAADNASDKLILHWDMTKNSEGKLEDLTGNNHNGVLNGSLENANVDGIDVLKMTGGYVDIPDGTISTDAKEVTINMLVKIDKNVSASWMWCLGSSDKHYMYFTGCCSANQGSVMRGGVGCVPASNPSGNGWSYESVINGSEALAAGQWQNITITYKDGGKFIFYRNGEKQAETVLSEGAAGNFTLQDLMTAGDARDGYMGWSFYEKNDPKFQGTVADFRIYEKEMSAADVTALATDMSDMLEDLASKDFTEADINLSEEDCLGTNTSKDKVTKDLVLPKTTTIGDYNKEGTITKWVSDTPDVISNEGKVTPGVVDQTVVLTASVTRDDVTVDKKLTFKVLGSATEEDLAKADAKELTVVNAEDVAGNLTLPKTGKYGSAITWTSSDEAVISSKDNGEVLAGKVNRQAKSTDVTLTATIKNGEAVETKEIVCHVRKAAEEIETTDYIFTYFPYTSFKDERVYFAISEDGLNFEALNDGKYVLESKVGTHGIRDPFIIRSHEGDKFYMIATDLTVAGLTQDGVQYPGQSWDKNQVYGSKSIVVWESDDLVNWSEERLCKVSVDTAGCTWAPEAYWDDATEQYVVFWASKVSDDGNVKQRLYYATTRDFHTFSDAKVWFEEAGSVIDTTVIKVDDYYYRYTKNEAGNANAYGTPSKRIYCERSKSLTSTDWELVSNNSLDISGGQIEGGCIFKINTDDVDNAKKVASLKGFDLKGDDVYCLTADRTGATIFPGLSDDITKGAFNVLGTGSSATVDGVKLYSMPDPVASHGTIMPVTSEEYDRLMKKYDTSYAEAAKSLSDKADKAKEDLDLGDVSAVIEDMTLPTESKDGAVISWSTSDKDIISADGKVNRPSAKDGDAVVELTATITLKGSDGVRDQVRTKTFKVTVKANDKEPGKDVTEIFEDISEGEWFVDYVQYVFDKGIMTGLDGTHFGPADILSRAQFATILYRVEGEPDVTYEPIYPDVPDNQFYSKAAIWASNMNAGAIKGYEDGTFGPNDNITREQMAAIMYRYAEYKGYDTKASAELDFPDSGDVSDFAKKAMKWAVAEGLISGNLDGTLAPQGTTSRAVCATIIQRFLENVAK